MEMKEEKERECFSVGFGKKKLEERMKELSRVVVEFVRRDRKDGESCISTLFVSFREAIFPLRSR